MINDVSKRKVRKNLLQRLLKMLSEKEVDGARREYKSPKERDSYNYGYMTVSEMGSGTPNVW